MSSPIFGSVVASDPTASGEAPPDLSWWTTSNEKVLEAADVVVFAFNDHINATQGLISAKSFEHVKQGALMVLFVGSLGVDEKAAYESVKSGRVGGMAINQWWERWAWRTPRDSPMFFDADWKFAPPSTYSFNELPNVLMAPNACEKSTEYWAGCATLVARHLEAAAEGNISCAVN